MRILKYISAGVLLLIILIAAVSVIIVKLYGEDIKRYFVDEINNHVESEIVVTDINFSVLRRFPDASVELKNVLIKSAGNTGEEIYSDTLLTASSVFFQFSLSDIFREKFNIKAVYATDGVLNIATGEQGRGNYRFWKEGKAGSDEFQIDLSDVRLNNFDITYQNMMSGFFLKAELYSLHVRGSFSGSISSFRLNTDLKTKMLSNENVASFRGRNIRAGLSVTVENGDFIIENGIFDIEGVKVSANGHYLSASNNLDIKFSGENIEADNFFDILTERSSAIPGNIRLEGKISLNGRINGKGGRTGFPSVSAKFGLENGILYKNRREVFLKAITIAGSYSNGERNKPETSAIVIDNYSAESLSGKIKGRGFLENFITPLITLETEGNLSLGELEGVFHLPGIIRLDGEIETKFALSGRLENTVKIDRGALAGFDVDGYIKVENGELDVEHWKYRPERINGRLNLGEIIIAENLDFYVGDDYFLINGQIENGLGYLLEKDQIMSFSGRIYLPEINLDKYIPESANMTEEGRNKTNPVFPENLEMKLAFETGLFRFRNFSATRTSGQLTYIPRMFRINSFDVESMGGVISGNGIIIQRYTSDFVINSQVSLQGVEIDRMFRSFKNFNQDFIKDHNIRGMLSGDISFASEFQPDLTIRSETTVADSKIEIEYGELVNFEPMLGLSRFIEVSELQHIKFSTLENEIFIRERRITIPQMDIHSSAINISGSGIHDFNSEFEYRLRVRLSDVLYGKSRPAKIVTPEFAIAEEHGRGGTSLFFVVSGKPDDYEVSYDRLAAREALKDQIQDEKRVLKGILNEEFGWFGNDTTLIISPEKEESSPRFRIIWDEDRKRDTVKTAPPDTVGKKF